MENNNTLEKNRDLPLEPLDEIALPTEEELAESDRDPETADTTAPEGSGEPAPLETPAADPVDAEAETTDGTDSAAEETDVSEVTAEATDKTGDAPAAEDLPAAPVIRTRPAVTEEDLKRVEGETRTRPAVTLEDTDEGEERQIHDGRITGEKHSEASTAAPIRTRTPEENRGITNGIPMRNSHRLSETPETETAEEVKGKGSVTLFAIAVAAVCVVLMLTGAVFAINRFYEADLTRPADFNMTLLPEGEIPHVSGKGYVTVDRTSGAAEKETAGIARETVGEEDTVPFETEGDTTAPDTVLPDTTPAETAAPETEAETLPPETEAPETRYTVTIQAYNRDPITVTLGSMTVRELFAITGFTLLENDRMYVELDSVIESDTVIAVDSVEYRTVDKTEAIPYTTVTNEVQTVPRGSVEVARPGEEGQTTYTYTVEFVNGQEVNRTLINEAVTKEPVTEILEKGIGGELMGSDGITYSYSYYRVVPATYYNIEGLTWAGTHASENTIATNFDYIPLGTRVYVRNDRFDFGVRTVEDTGTMEGYEVDIWIGEDNPQLADFAYIGYHYDMVIYYLD